MKIREFQEYIVERLNVVKALVQGGCKAFAEDTRIAASRQRHRGSHAGLDYVERIYAAQLKPGEKKSIFTD